MKLSTRQWLIIAALASSVAIGFGALIVTDEAHRRGLEVMR